ncbi:unnamed protein product [Orchesella dallaii]|uniref:Uncharacterized protein n=1 Tax=Orchesella dallaii TaxID=48710 RepID=A0ABP1PMQ3_9HEXA
MGVDNTHNGCVVAIAYDQCMRKSVRNKMYKHETVEEMVKRPMTVLNKTFRDGMDRNGDMRSLSNDYLIDNNANMPINHNPTNELTNHLNHTKNTSKENENVSNYNLEEKRLSDEESEQQRNGNNLKLEQKTCKILIEAKHLDFKLTPNQARLFELVKSEDLYVIKKVLSIAAGKLKIPEICRYEENNQVSLLHVAVKHQGYDVVEYLVNKRGFGHCLHKPIFQNTLIHDCMQDINEVDAERFEEKVKILELLFTKHPPLIDSINEEHHTPLHVATCRMLSNREQLELIDMLLCSDARVNATDRYGHTPLHLTVFKYVSERLMSTIQLLIENHADPDAQDRRGCTFLHHAARNVSPSIFYDIVNYLVSIERTDSFNIPDIDGWTVLHYAVWTKPSPLVETLKLFKTHMVDFNAVTFTDDSILFKAIEKDVGESLLNALIEFGADWRIRNKNRDTALHNAAY